MDLSNSVILPREDFYELQATANQPQSLGERLAGTAQTTVVFTVLVGAVTAGSFGVAKAVDWLEQRRFKRAGDMLVQKHNLNQK